MATLSDLGVYTLPSWSLCYLVNGDHGNLEDEEIEMIDAFAADLIAQGYSGMIYEFPGESHFNHHPEFGLPCDCYDVHIYARFSLH